MRRHAGHPKGQEPREVGHGRGNQHDERRPARPVDQQVDGDRAAEEEAHPGKRQGRDQGQGGGDATAGADRRFVQQQHGEQPAKHRTDESDLKGPQDVFSAPAQEEKQQHGTEGEGRPGSPSDDREQQQRRPRVQQLEDGQVGPVGTQADGREQGAIDQNRERRPVFVVGPKEDLCSRATTHEDEGPFIPEEVQPAAEVEQDRNGQQAESGGQPGRPAHPEVAKPRARGADHRRRSRVRMPYRYQRR